MRRALPDLIGQQFGKLVVLEVVEHAEKGQRRYLVQCACGSGPRVVQASALLRGHVRSCGCLVQEHLRTMKRRFYRRYTHRKESHGAPDSESR